MKTIEYNNIVQRITWTEEKVQRMNALEELQSIVIGKYSFGWIKCNDLRNQIPKQCRIKGVCKIELLRNRHILMKFNLMKDFVNMMSNNVHYITTKENTTY